MLKLHRRHLGLVAALIVLALAASGCQRSLPTGRWIERTSGDGITIDKEWLTAKGEQYAYKVIGKTVLELDTDEGKRSVRFELSGDTLTLDGIVSGTFDREGSSAAQAAQAKREAQAAELKKAQDKAAALASPVTSVDAAGLVSAQQQGAQVVDVRTGGEYQAGHIAGAKNAPLDELEGIAANWDRSARYVVYDATGSRSAGAAARMKAMGFANVSNLENGLQQWTGSLEKSTGSTQDVNTSGRPVLIEFYSASDPSSRKMKPLVEKLKNSYGGKVEFRLLDIDSDQGASELAGKLGVQFVPAFVFVTEGGFVSDTIAGETTEQALAAGLKAIAP